MNIRRISLGYSSDIRRTSKTTINTSQVIVIKADYVLTALLENAILIWRLSILLNINLIWEVLKYVFYKK